MLPVRTIVHPTDFSASSQYAFRVAATLARDHGARLVVMHVATVPSCVLYGEVEKALQLPCSYRQELEEKLRRLPMPDPKVHAEYQMEEGDPAAEILRVAYQTQCELIVMGTHGRTGMGRLLTGSVAEQVMRKAACPVLTVKSLLTVPHLSLEAVPVGANAC